MVRSLLLNLFILFKSNFVLFCFVSIYQEFIYFILFRLSLPFVCFLFPGYVCLYDVCLFVCFSVCLSACLFVCFIFLFVFYLCLFLLCFVALPFAFTVFYFLCCSYELQLRAFVVVNFFEEQYNLIFIL